MSKTTTATTLQKLSAEALAIRAVAALGNLGDVFTEAPGLAHAVAAANNLRILAKIVTANMPALATGTLMVKGLKGSETVDVCLVDILVDGSLRNPASETTQPQLPEGFDLEPQGYPQGLLEWSVRLSNGKVLSVNFYFGDTPAEDAWVISQADDLYRAVLVAPALSFGGLFEDNVRYLLDHCPHTVRDMSGDRTGTRGVEDLVGSLSITFLGMQHSLAAR